MRQLETDIAIVEAGSSASVFASERGTRVMMFEKASTTGGTGNDVDCTSHSNLSVAVTKGFILSNKTLHGMTKYHIFTARKARLSPTARNI